MEENEKRIVELHPLSKWKRILLFLGDFAITFILSFVLFNLAIFPLGKIICQTEQKSKEAASYEKLANDLLISGGVILEDPDGSGTFEGHVNHTFKVFLSYYAFDEETPDASHPYYGHKAQNEVIRNFYVNYLHDEEGYLAAFRQENEANQMFVIGNTVNEITLKDDYKSLLSNELLEVTDESKYSTHMTNFRDNVFARLFYIHVYQDNIKANDYIVGDASYLDCLDKSSKIMDPLKWIPVACTYISIILAWGAVYLLYPMINGERRTPTMSIMKVNILHSQRLIGINRTNVLIHSFYDLLFNISYGVFLPILFFYSGAFNLPILFIASLISAVLIIVSLFFVLFNQHNRSGSDLLTFTVAIPTSEIDNLYKETHSDERFV